MTATNIMPENIVIVLNYRDFRNVEFWYPTQEEALEVVGNSLHRIACDRADSSEANLITAHRIQDGVYAGEDGAYYDPEAFGQDHFLPTDSLYEPQDTYSTLINVDGPVMAIFACQPVELPRVSQINHIQDALDTLSALQNVVAETGEVEEMLPEYGSEEARKMASRQLATNKACTLDCLHNLADAAASYWATTSEENRQEQNDTYRNFLDRLMEAIARSL